MHTIIFPQTEIYPGMFSGQENNTNRYRQFCLVIHAEHSTKAAVRSMYALTSSSLLCWSMREVWETFQSVHLFTKMSFLTTQKNPKLKSLVTQRTWSELKGCLHRSNQCMSNIICVLYVGVWDQHFWAYSTQLQVICSVILSSFCWFQLAVGVLMTSLKISLKQSLSSGNALSSWHFYSFHKHIWFVPFISFFTSLSVVPGLKIQSCCPKLFSSEMLSSYIFFCCQCWVMYQVIATILLATW